MSHVLNVSHRDSAIETEDSWNAPSMAITH